jgi:putative sterol carrier protein
MTTLSPAEYYAKIVPQKYEAAMAGASQEVLSQPPISVTFDIDGELHSLQALGPEMTYTAGAIDSPDMLVQMSTEDWRVSAEQGAAEAMIDYIQRRKVQVVKGLRGSVTLELDRSDGSTLKSTTIFGQPEPVVTIMMTADDYEAMLRGELNGQMAFMMGRLKFDGSLPLLMAIGALAG